MNSPNGYFQDLLRTLRRLGAPAGVLLVALALPGLLASLMADGQGIGLSLRIGIASFSVLLCAGGLIIIFLGMRASLHFSPRPRLPVRLGGKRKAQEARKPRG
jgi:hypothetical protein